MISLCKRRNAKKQCKKAVQNAMQKDVMQRKETAVSLNSGCCGSAALAPKSAKVSEAS